jgi:nucleoside 2-deoxyribosyltransferase
VSESDRIPVAYLAGPDVFLSTAGDIAAMKKQICHEHGFAGRFPTDPPDAEITPAGDAGLEIFRQCIQNLRESDLIIANLTPFRGPSMDIGTAVEIGFMYGHGRPVFGYTNVTPDYRDRVTDDGMIIEDFGFADNLMCEGPIRETAHAQVVRTDVPEMVRFTDLHGFEECVRQAREYFNQFSGQTPCEFG